MNSADFFRLRRQSSSSLCSRRISEKLCRKALRATAFQPESMIQIRKRGAAGGLYFRIRTAFRGRAGSSRTISVVAVAGSIGCDMVATSEGVASAAIGLSPASGGAPGFVAGALLLDAFVLLLGRRGCSVPERLLGITAPPSPQSAAAVR